MPTKAIMTIGEQKFVLPFAMEIQTVLLSLCQAVPVHSGYVGGEHVWVIDETRPRVAVEMVQDSQIMKSASFNQAIRRGIASGIFGKVDQPMTVAKGENSSDEAVGEKPNLTIFMGV
jgi:hypothetical protein